MPETETIVTEYGEVEADTEKCENCGDRVLAEQTLDVVMGKAIASFNSGSNYEAHRGVVGLEKKRYPETQIWCMECAEYELGYAAPAGTEGRYFPTLQGAILRVLNSPATTVLLTVLLTLSLLL